MRATYTGTAGRVENAQVAVHLSYSAARGHAAIDRSLYVTRSWTEDQDRCRSAGIPDELAFATKPRLAVGMVQRALDAGTPARWAAGDEVYGDSPHLRTDRPGTPPDRLRPRCLQYSPKITIYGWSIRPPAPGPGSRPRQQIVFVRLRPFLIAGFSAVRAVAVVGGHTAPVMRSLGG